MNRQRQTIRNVIGIGRDRPLRVIQPRPPFWRTAEFREWAAVALFLAVSGAAIVTAALTRAEPHILAEEVEAHFLNERISK